MDTPLYTCRQFRLLIAGSRHASAELLKRAYMAVERARANGWAILVGDAEGVDAAVIVGCNKLGVNYLCAGITRAPRSENFRSAAQGGTGFYIRHASDVRGDYAARDRLLVDMADRVLCLWNGGSRGTRLVYDYARKVGRPVDLLTLGGAQPTPQRSARAPRTPQPSVVELVVSALPGEDGMHGTLGLRALDGNGKVLYETREALLFPDIAVPDYAKLRLKDRLRGGESAAYTLRIVQSSKLVEGWLSHGWKRNAETAAQLAGAADVLLRAFPQQEWVKMPKAQVTALLAGITTPVH
jgi:hypothetical protein